MTEPGSAATGVALRLLAGFVALCAGIAAVLVVILLIKGMLA